MSAGAARTTALTAAVSGGLLVAVTSLLAAFSPAIIVFLLWALLPYAALASSYRFTHNPWIIAGAGAAAIAVEAGVRAGVFLFPRGSTAGIALVFSPAMVLFIAMPIGAAFGWAFSRAPLLVRVPLAAIAMAALALTFIGFARPELLPTAVAARRAALESIGEPRVIVGGGAFARTEVSDRSAWYQAGDFDGEPGDEIAIVDHDGAELIDPDDIASRSRVPFGGQIGRLWSWYSRLQRMGGRLVVVQGGGGYQDTEVRTLDNTLLWRYHPDEKLPPTALKAADLDADGETEFYASAMSHVARLDGSGREVWRQPAVLSTVIDLAPRQGPQPAWVVAAQYAMKVHIWDHAGATVAELPWPNGGVLGVVDWPEARGLVVNGPPAAVITLDGRRVELPVAEPMTLQQAMSIRWTADSPPMLALVTAAPTGVDRWRLQLLDTSARVVYDEVVERPVGLMVARHRSGRSSLLLNSHGLTSLAPVDP